MGSKITIQNFPEFNKSSPDNLPLLSSLLERLLDHIDVEVPWDYIKLFKLKALKNEEDIQIQPRINKNMVRSRRRIV